MILHNATGGNFEIYDLGNNAILAAAPLQLGSGMAGRRPRRL